MRLTRLQCEQFKKLTAIDIAFGDHVTEISGANGAGKSSTLDSIYVALKGLDVAPDDPIRHGSDYCTIRTHLKGDDNSVLLVTRRFREGKEGKTASDLVLETPDGARFTSPQTHLNKLISDHMLDPLEFIDMKDEAQFDVLRSFVPGFDFAKNEQLRKGAYDSRTDVNRDQKKAQAAADAIDILGKAPGERTDEAELTAELQSAGEKNLDIERRKANRENAANRVRQLRASITATQADCDGHVADIQREIEELTALIETKRRQAAESIAASTAEADDLQAKLDAAEALPDTVDAAAITAKLNEARKANRLIDDWETQRARRANHRRDADALAKESEALTAKITELEHAKQEAIQKAALPVDGLGFGDGFITLNGVRFSQASTAEKLRTAFAISIAKRPKLRLCWIRDASLLDDASLKIVEQLAREFDVQVLLETVRPNSSNAIVLEDGHVKGAEVPAPIDAPVARSDAAPTDRPARSRRGWKGPGEAKDLLS